MIRLMFLTIIILKSMLLKHLIRYRYVPMINFPKRKVNQGSVKLTNLNALSLAIKEELQRNPKVYLIGESVSQQSGASRVTKGLFQIFGEQRVKDTPVSQAGLTGLVCGSALMGLSPILQFQTMSASLKGIDHILNSCGKLHYMSAGQLRGGAIVFRGANALTKSGEAQQSQCMASFYCNIPGLITISPYDAQDCKGLLKAAIRNQNPVIFLQNESLYQQEFQVPEEVMDKDFLLPIGKAKIMKEGKDVTIVAFSKNVLYSLQAAEYVNRHGISCEVINLRTLRPLDRDAIVNSVKKTGRLVTVEDGYPQSGIGAQIIGIVNQTVAFDYLKGPVQRVTAADVPVPFAAKWQQHTYPRADTISRAIRKAFSFK